MNCSVIRYILGCVLKIEAVLLTLPGIVGIIYGEKEAAAYFITAAIAFGVGLIMSLKKPQNFVFYLKEGCLITALSWIVMSIFGAVAFMLSGEFTSFIDAMFETVSGFTTTGASILTDVEVLSHATLFWRSFTHWVGGMGVLVFMLAVLPLTGGSNINIMKAESPGPSVGKLVPRVKHTARILYIIYLVFTVLQIVLLLFGDMNLFDAMTTTFGTAGTGGFGIKNDSIASFSPYVQWVIAIFMVIFGVNFNAYYFIILRKIKNALKIEEVRYYFLIIIAATAIIFANIYETTANVLDTIRHAFFTVASIITTTGYSTLDFDLWAENAKIIILALMFIGACAGSTGGGIKISRILIWAKTIKKEFKSYMHPKSIKKIKMDGKEIEHDVVRSVNVYMAVYVFVFAVSLFLLSFENQSFITTFSSVATALNNIGPGFDAVGPARNFAGLTDFSKVILTLDMLIGRLELFPVLLLFYPPIWKEAVVSIFARKKNKDKSKNN